MRTTTETASPSDAIARLTKFGLTERQAEIYIYIFETTRMTGIQPSFKELGEQFSITSPNGVACHLEALSRKGWIAMAEGHSRSLRFLKCPDNRTFKGFCLPEEDSP
jgi:SOS-response transcriptional repressor LexA